MHFTGTNSNGINVDGLGGESKELNLDSNPYWTQISILETLVISDKKPNINGIESVSAKAKTIKQKVICTPKSAVCNIHGKYLTGRILVIKGEINQLVHYTGALPEHPVHTERFTSNFSTSVVVPQNIKGIDSLNVNFQTNVCIEDVSIIGVGAREVLESVALLIQAVPISGFE